MISLDPSLEFEQHYHQSCARKGRKMAHAV